jgi:hypothetical protein
MHKSRSRQQTFCWNITKDEILVQKSFMKKMKSVQKLRSAQRRKASSSTRQCHKKHEETITQLLDRHKNIFNISLFSRLRSAHSYTFSFFFQIIIFSPYLWWSIIYTAKLFRSSIVHFNSRRFYIYFYFFVLMFDKKIYWMSF